MEQGGCFYQTWGAFHKTCHQWQMTAFVISFWNPCLWLVISRYVTDFCHLSLKKGFVKQAPDFPYLHVYVTYVLWTTALCSWVWNKVLNWIELKLNFSTVLKRSMVLSGAIKTSSFSLNTTPPPPFPMKKWSCLQCPHTCIYCSLNRVPLYVLA